MNENQVYKRSHASLSDVENEGTNNHADPLVKKVKHADMSMETVGGSEKGHPKSTYDLEDMFDEDDDFGINLQDLENVEQFSLDLTTWKRCRVLSINNCGPSFVIIVEEKKSNLKAKCSLEPPWNSLHVKKNDVISLIGVLDRVTGFYRIDSSDGMIVTDPDHLISGTSVVGALYCQRRGVLQERFRGIDADSRIMTIGTIVHALLQKTLKNRCTELEDINMIGREYLNSPEMVHMLYAAKMTKVDAAKEMEQFYPKIHDFIINHLVIPGKYPKSDVQIKTIKDIEENIWCHQLGIKGKIDVTVEAKCEPNQPVQLMPLELKTGRASFSAEHKGQIILYEMMMNLVGHKVDQGILLYLREGKCSSVKSNRNLKRDLIMLRNEVAYYLSRGLPNTKSDEFDLHKDIMLLPEPLNNKHICSRCPYSTICTAYLKYEKLQLPPEHAIKLIATDALGHLSDKHIDYFIRWAGLIYLEDEENRKKFRVKHFWTKSPEMRQKMGRAAINLKLIAHVSHSGEDCCHTFSLDDDINCSMNVTQIEGIENLSKVFDVNEYVICSTTTRIAVAAGRVVNVSKREITVSLERDLSQNYPHELFHLDKYESQTQITFNLTNVGVLLDDTERSATLRRIIIDGEKPTFTRTIPSSVADAAKEILQGLNKHQKIAVLTAVGTKSFCLFKGLPGTGKTQTVIALIRLLVAMNKSVLITSNTHSAVDNVLKRLLPHGMKFIRLGAKTRIDSELTIFSEGDLTEKCSTPEELATVYNSYKIVGVTCLGSAHSMLVQRTFDFCIVDEATQVFQSAVIRPLLSSDKFVLIGDPDQLPPVILSRKAKDLGADESLFFRLETDHSCCVLPTQYRMNRTITKLANDFSYQGKLICANESVANSSLKLPNVRLVQQKYKLEKWLLRATASQLDLSVVLINTLNTYGSSKAFESNRSKTASSVNHKTEDLDQPKAVYENYCEVAVVIYTVKALLESGVAGTAIGVIAPFRVQVDLLRHYLDLLKKQFQDQGCIEQNLNIEVNTVDQYQGKDKEIIFYSCTKSNNPATESTDPTKASEHEILEDYRRLTVAITRAKKKLVILGDVMSLERYTPFKKLFQCIPAGGRITLQQSSFGFEWDRVFNLLDTLHNFEDKK
ncbi:DNA replication ATP-dependent helicase/nuclease DNA2 [Uranotaenia lowii]|uniref:DNA replication ATP-dependent helicase/nuclease DNA2 n=1 Tax=Uranotaenia lowii TaxID=190385 RepID=UPI0024796666|nr:DNA replication ATP-dependent helicase/nuclease DNA2 [Uranotaenia lowii]